MQMGKAHALWLTWVVATLGLFVFFFARQADKKRALFADSLMLSRLMASLSVLRRRWKTTFIFTSLALMVFAMAQPRIGYEWQEIRREGVDIVIALDVSDSMLVQDGEVGDNLTRIERAKREIQDLITRLDGDRIALVAFAGEAFVESPLTLDYSAARMFLDEIDTDIIPVKGTAIGAALERSLEAFDGGQSASKAILLITDGEDHTNLAQKAAEKAKEAGVRIFAIGIGRNEGAPVPGPDGGFRRDKMGQIILSRLDEHTLQKIAITTGGRYVRSVSGDMDLEEIYESGIKAELKSRELGSKRQKLWKERFQIFLLIALLLLAIEPFISERTRERENA